MNVLNQTENNAKLDYPTKYVDMDYDHLSSTSNFVENYLKILENFTLMLLNTNEKINGLSKLGYCYCYLNTIRWQLKNPSFNQKNFLMDIAKSLVKRLQSSLGVVESSGHHCHISNEHNKHRCIMNPISAKYNICRKKSKRKSKSYKKNHDSVNIDHSKIILNRLYGNLFYPEDIKNPRVYNIPHIIDQMYTQIRTVLSENCIDDADIFKELSASIKEDYYTKSTVDTNRLIPVHHESQFSKHQEQLSSGDCKIMDDSKDLFSDQFDKLLALNNLDIDVTLLAEKMFSTNTNGQKNRFRKYSELDEGFSENEFLHFDNKLDENESSKLSCYEQFSYCGDCDYNSSNSKSEDKLSTDFYSPPNYVMPVENSDDGSDSDGGTELLNSVNDTVNKFNAIMQCTLNTNSSTHIDEKSSKFSLSNLEQPVIENQLPLRYQPIFDNRVSDDGHLNTSFQKKSFDKTELWPIDPNSTGSQLSNPVVYKDERYEPTLLSVNNFQQSSPISSLSSLNYDTVSKMLLSPVSIQNWCSYNFSQISTPSCNVNFHTKPSMNIDINNNPNSDSYCSGKLSSWLPPISHGLISTNSYIIGSNSHQPPFHRIMLTPHLTIPSTNIGHMQPNIVHLPQLFQQMPHSIIDTEFYDRRQIPMNQPGQFSNNPNNNNSSSGQSVSPPVSLVANSNCSNMAISSNLQQSISIIKSSLNKSQRACCFYMRGGCKKEDCEYAHDLSKVTCKFWEKGDCFKADTCPFKHGYMKV